MQQSDEDALTAGLLAASLCAWIACPTEFVSRLPLAAVAPVALGFVLVVFVSALASLYRAGRRKGVPADEARVAAVLVWFAPVAVFASQPWTGVAFSVAVVVSAWSMKGLRGAPMVQDSGLLMLFHEPYTTDFRPKLANPLWAAACLQAGLLCSAKGSAGGATVLVGIALGALSPRAFSLELLAIPRVSSLRQCAGRAAIHILLASLVTALGLARPVLLMGAGSEAGSGASAAADNEAEAGSTDAERIGEGEKAEEAALGGTPDGTYDGVILFAKATPEPLLVPPLPAFRASLVSGKRLEPQSIPFYGAYWFFRPPDRKPPRGSHLAYGRPDRISYRSTDRRPLIMQAHQNLGTVVDLACCEAIEVWVSNADTWPGTIALELILVETSDGTRPSLSLGKAPVLSRPTRWPGAGQAFVPEVLRFEVPREPALRRFDQLTMVFHRDRIRHEKSARLAIEKFVLVPRTAVIP